MFKKMIFAMCVTATMMAAGTVGATTIEFDDIGVAGTVFPSYTHAGFVDQGFNFSANMDVVDISAGSPWPHGGGHSGAFATLNDYGGTMTMSAVGGGTFSAQNLWVHGWYNGNVSGTVEGWLSGNLVGSVGVSAGGSTWDNIVLNFANVDTLKFVTNNIFLMDDINVNGTNSSAIPEPSSIALLVLGAIALIARRKRSV